MTEKHKLYFLMFMVCIAAMVGYFRFFRSNGAVENPKAALIGQTLQPPSAMASHRAELVLMRNAAVRPAPTRSISRNIFEPVGPLPVRPQPKRAAAVRMAEEELTLNGTITGQDASIAIINNKFIRLGQKIGRYRLTRITPDKVYLMSGNDQRCLEIVSATEAITQ